MREVHLNGEHDDETTAPGVAGTTFAVSDMTCGHCVGTLRDALSRALPGAPVEIDLARHRVTVDGDAGKAAAAIRAAGYTPERVGA